MASPALPGQGPAAQPPPADPQAIRESLPPALAAEFDAEWELVLEQAKQSKTLTGVHELLNKWRHTAYLELRDPGAYGRLLAKADLIERTGTNPDAVPFVELQAAITGRLGR